MPERADSVYQLAGEVGRLLPDTGLWAESLCRRAVIAINKGKEHYAEAEDSLLLARELLRSNTNKQAQRILTDALSGLYARLRDGAKAVRFAKENLALQADTTTCYVAWALLGEAYYRSQQYDSAMHYLISPDGSRIAFCFKAANPMACLWRNNIFCENLNLGKRIETFGGLDGFWRAHWFWLWVCSVVGVVNAVGGCGGKSNLNCKRLMQPRRSRNCKKNCSNHISGRTNNARR